MKLAEALSIRADLQKRISQIGERLDANAKVQEGDKPAESPEVLIREMDENIRQLEQLISGINRVNCNTVVNGVTLTDLIAKRDVLSLKNSILRNFLKSASAKVDRYSNKEIRINSSVDVGKMQKQVDALSKEIRETDMLIQSANWTTEYN